MIHKLMNDFIVENCPIERAKMLKEIKDTTNMSYVGLSLKLYDSIRNLKRLYKLNNLIPEYKELYKDGFIKKIVAYELSSLSEGDQLKIYKIFKYKLDLKMQAKQMLQHIEEYQKISEKEIEVYFDNKTLMDSLAAELEEKEQIENNGRIS